MTKRQLKRRVKKARAAAASRTAIPGRGKVKAWRTIKTPDGAGYRRVAIVAKPGPRGGHTVAMPPQYPTATQATTKPVTRRRARALARRLRTPR